MTPRRKTHEEDIGGEPALEGCRMSAGGTDPPSGPAPHTSLMLALLAP